MSISPEDAQARARIGGLTKAALAPDRRELTRAANDARARKYVDQVKAALPDLTDQDEITRRAGLLLRADMVRLALRSATVRRRRRQLNVEKAQLIVLAAELDASGLLDCGSDGVDADGE